MSLLSALGGVASGLWQEHGGALVNLAAGQVMSALGVSEQSGRVAFSGKPKKAAPSPGTVRPVKAKKHAAVRRPIQMSLGKRKKGGAKVKHHAKRRR